MPLAAATRKPHYLTASEQARLEVCAAPYWRNIIVIMVEMRLRPYRELIPMRDLGICVPVHGPSQESARPIALRVW